MLLNVISIYLFISIIVATFFAAFIQSRGKAAYVKIIMLLCLAIDIYMFGYAAELYAVSMAQKLFWNKFQYVGIPFVSALWLTVGLVYTRKLRPRPILKLALAYIIPVLTLIFRFTNDLHHLYFTSMSIQALGENALLLKGKGIWYYVQSVHSMGMIFTTFALFISTFVKRKDNDDEKGAYMLAASAFATLGLILNILQIGGANIDYLALCLPIVVVLVVLAIVRNDFLETKTLAREVVFEKSSEGMILLNMKMRILDFNKTAADLFMNQGITLNRSMLETVFENDHALAKRISASEPGTWMACNEDGVKYYNITTTDIIRDNGLVYGKLKIVRDITQMQLLHDHLKAQATIDDLSGLLNRREFMHLCETYLHDRRAATDRFCLLMIDIDWFKHINDTYGHATGDYVIHCFGSLLRQSFRGTDLIGRLGGEEFTVLMKTETCEAAYGKAEYFREKVEKQLFTVNENSLHITVSVGIAGLGTEMKGISDLMNQADKALYAAKNNGRNRTMIFDGSVPG